VNGLTNLIPELTQERCTRYRYRYSSCSRCADQCPHHALTLSDEGVGIEAGSCTGCALCVASCPTAVFHAANLPLAAIAKPKSESLSIACSPSELQADVSVPCLGAIDVALLASLGLRGIKVTLRGSKFCEQCANAPRGGQRLQAVLDAMANVDAFNEDSPYSLPVLDDMTEGSGMDRRRAGRRQLFRRWLAIGAEADRSDTQPAAEIPAAAIRYAAHFIPTRRRLADKVLGQLAEPICEEMSGLTWAVAYVDVGGHDCTGCEACARVCPTGALKVTEEGDDWKLIASASQCVGCGVCIEACTANAIALHHGWQITETPLPTLHALRRHRCQECGRYFIGIAEDTCPVCSDDSNSFSAIFG